MDFVKNRNNLQVNADTLYDYFEELRRLRSKIEEYEPEPEEDEPGLELY